MHAEFPVGNDGQHYILHLKYSPHGYNLTIQRVNSLEVA